MRGPKQRFLKPRKWSAGGVEGRQTPRGGRNFGDAHILGALESIQPDIQGPSSTISEVVICIFSCRLGTEPTWRLVKARPKPLEMEEGICDLLLLSAALTLACRQLDSSCMAQRARLFHKSSPRTPGCQDFDCFSSESTLKILVHEAHDGRNWSNMTTLVVKT